MSSEASHTFVIRTAERPKYVVVDPELLVLGTVKLDAPGDMLRAQLVYAKTSRGRVLAARALSHVDDLPTTKALAASLANEEESWGCARRWPRPSARARTMAAFDALAASRRCLTRRSAAPSSPRSVTSRPQNPPKF
jgi:aminopeptidase N